MPTHEGWKMRISASDLLKKTSCDAIRKSLMLFFWNARPLASVRDAYCCDLRDTKVIYICRRAGPGEVLLASLDPEPVALVFDQNTAFCHERKPR